MSFATWLLCLGIFFSQALFAENLQLAWDPVSSSQLGGYELQHRLSSGNYENSTDVGNNTSYTVTGLQAGQTYEFRVRAYSADRSIWSDFSNEVTKTVSRPAPVATFTTNKTTGEAPLTILFTDASSGRVTGRTWQFGDGGSTTGAAMATYTYTAPGTYDVQLAVSGPDGSDVELKTNHIVVQAPQDNGDSGDTGGDSSSGDSGAGDTGGNSGLGGSSTLIGGIIEAGEITLDDQWQRIEFQQTFTDPVVVVKLLSSNDGAPAIVRVDDVDGNGFSARIQEWDYLDGSHFAETATYLVVERGQHQLPDGSLIEAVLLDTDKTGSFDSVSFTAPFTQVPVVLSGVSTYNGSDAVVTRLRRIDRNGFQVRMQEQERNRQRHIVETLAFIAIEPTSGTVDGLRLEVGRTNDIVTHHTHALSFSTEFDQPPLFLADMQSTDGGDPANVRWRDKTARWVDVWIDEEQSKDSETNHITETVGYLAIEAGDSGPGDDPDTSGDTSGSDTGDSSDTSSGGNESGGDTNDEPSAVLNEGFDAYANGDQPAGWLDTAADNSMSQDDSLFRVMDLSGERVIGTSSTATNIHSHHTAQAVNAITAYEYTGRMRITDASGGVGITFLSDYPNRDAYYRLRRYSGNAFHLSPHGTSVLGDVETGITPAKNVWYQYRIQVEDTGPSTQIRAKVWAQGQTEPTNWQVEAYDNSASRLTSGSVGLWSMGPGYKYWDDVSAKDLAP